MKIPRGLVRETIWRARSAGETSEKPLSGAGSPTDAVDGVPRRRVPRVKHRVPSFRGEYVERGVPRSAITDPYFASGARLRLLYRVRAWLLCGPTQYLIR